MKIGAILTALFLLFAAVSIPDCADAARMGGGKSFGSKPFMNTPSAPPAGMRQQTNRQATGPMAGAAATKPGGMLGGMGGIFGGLLAGTLLGSLISGNGFGGGGGFMDILLFAILAFVAWKLFQRFRSRPQPEAQPAGVPGNPFGQSQNPLQSPMQQSDLQGGVWDKLQNISQGQAPQAAETNADVPADFNTEEFLRGAKMAYNRMQQSWDRRDLEDISQFATPAVMRELKAQAAEDPNPSRTEIMQVNAQVVGAEPEGDNMRAQVYFDVLMREDLAAQAPTNVREIWHFLRIGKNGNWKLDGIQQVD